jgi:hypothetical protein
MQYVHYYCTFTSQRIARTNQGRAMVQRFSGGRGRREASAAREVSAAREAAMVPGVDGERRGGGGRWEAGTRDERRPTRQRIHKRRRRREVARWEAGTRDDNQPTTKLCLSYSPYRFGLKWKLMLISILALSQ